jgi:hypothetical protein
VKKGEHIACQEKREREKDKLTTIDLQERNHKEAE